ncbi:MAG: TIGR00303 family protein [Geminocystis sp.]|nr:TIGR00303 family protein [Geminocystis sp.]
MTLDDIKIYTETERGRRWLEKYQNRKPIFTCTFAFTATASIEGISNAGNTPSSRRFTALADAEFLAKGIQPHPVFPLPPLSAGVSPTLISRAVVEKWDLPLYLFNAGLPYPPSVSMIDLGGKTADCVSTGKALPLSVVEHLHQQGLKWGTILAEKAFPHQYLLLAECVVAGTTTALAVLTALRIPAYGMVNSSHPVCNHQQKWQIVCQGLSKTGGRLNTPLGIIAAVGDPMQVVVASIALAASQKVGVMLAGGTQMLAVFALVKALARHYDYPLPLDNIIVATTRWVAEDYTGNTVALAENVGDVSLCATQLDFTNSSWECLRAYERGFVKEGVGAGGSAVAAHLLGVDKHQLRGMVEVMVSRFLLQTVSQC